MMAHPHEIIIAQIAGRDSVAAAVSAVRDHGFARVLPTFAFTGTEIGDGDTLPRAVETLTRLLGSEVEVLEPATLTEPTLWSALNARYATALTDRFGLYSACMACHLYLHLLRVPVAWTHGNAPVVSGERDTHDGRVKLSQTVESIDASIRVLDYAGIELLQPVRAMPGAKIAELVGSEWPEDAGQLGCLHSGNYRHLDGSVTYDATGYARYVREFFEPVGRAIIDTWRAGEASDYDAIVRRTLEANRP